VYSCASSTHFQVLKKKEAEASLNSMRSSAWLNVNQQRNR
jgi:hypothetical protein